MVIDSRPIQTHTHIPDLMAGFQTSFSPSHYTCAEKIYMCTSFFILFAVINVQRTHCSFK